MSTPQPLSPCVKICVVHPDSGLCVGCYRSMDEIAAWSLMDDDERQRIIAERPAREGLHKKRRGGRAGKLADRG